MANANGRSHKVRDLLRLRMHPLTTREICADLGLPIAEAKFVSSQLVTAAKSGLVNVFHGHLCTITNRKVDAYMWADPTAGRSYRAQPKAKSAPQEPKPRKAPRLTVEETRRAEAKRKAAEEASKTRQQWQAAVLATDRRKQAFLMFERHTGCRSKDPAEMKKAYYRASLKHHPDRGGDVDIMSELNNAWSEIEAKRNA